ncbi:MAG: flagellar hook-length control protein FliK [Pseudolabrys sp.]
MPQVASEAPAPAYKPSLPNPARLGPSSGRAPATPFESLFGDDPQAPSDQPSPPPANSDPRGAQSNSADGPSQATDSNAASTNDSKATQAADNTTTQPASDAKFNNAGKAVFTALVAKVSKGASADKTNADDKAGEQTAAGDSSKPTVDANATGSPTLPDPTAVVASDSVQTIAPVAALVTASLSDATRQAAPAAAQAAIGAVGTFKTKSDAAPGKLADDSNPSTKAEPTPQASGKLQPAAGDADKQAAAPPHDESVINNQRTAAEAPPAIAIDARAAAPNVTGDTVQQAALTAPSQNAAAAANPSPASQLAPQVLAVPLAGIAVEIAGKALVGKNRFEIRLDPPELGRIEVRLDVDRDGNTTTRLIAERSDTLDLLRRDSSGLERALQDAGLKTADNGLQFSLRDRSMGRDPNNTPAPGSAQIVVQDDLLPAADIAPRNYGRLTGLGGGIDIRV